MIICKLMIGHAKYKLLKIFLTILVLNETCPSCLPLKELFSPMRGANMK